MDDFVKFVHDFFTTRIQSRAKLVGTPVRISVITLIIKRCVCVNTYMFKAHFLNLLPPPPSPTKQCWGTHTPPSFTVYNHCQHCFRGAGSVVKITKCPNSFAQDCIRVMKKSSINSTKLPVTQEPLKVYVSFLQEMKIVLISLLYHRNMKIEHYLF